VSATVSAAANWRPDLGRLRRYLSENGLPDVGELSASEIAGGRSNLTFRISDRRGSWVLRRPPLAASAGAHDVAREYVVVAALASTAVPVASVVARCDDPSVLGAPFTVVEYVDGRTLRTAAELASLTDDQIADCQRELTRVLVALHAVAPEEVGLRSFGRPEGFAGRQVRLWRRQWDTVATRELPDVDRLFRALETRIPETADSSIVHGDFRVDNTLLDPVDPGRVLALIDWEMATLGDPLTDIATMCAYQNPAFDEVVGEAAASTSSRWPDASRLLADYSDASGRPLGDTGFYLGLAHFKLAIIAEGIASRHRVGSGQEAGYATSHLAVPELLAAGLSALRS
jgi:aminoglycoside phosphotransferase (APT) family kinase protein